MSEEIWEGYRAIKHHQKEERMDTKTKSIQRLVDENIHYTTANGGVHCIVEGSVGNIDYWPSTGRWHSRCGKKGFGIQALVMGIRSGMI